MKIKTNYKLQLKGFLKIFEKQNTASTRWHCPKLPFVFIALVITEVSYYWNTCISDHVYTLLHQYTRKYSRLMTIKSLFVSHLKTNDARHSIPATPLQPRPLARRAHTSTVIKKKKRQANVTHWKECRWIWMHTWKSNWNLQGKNYAVPEIIYDTNQEEDKKK